MPLLRLPISSAPSSAPRTRPRPPESDCTADDRGSDRVELEEQARRAADRAADTRRQRHAGDAVAEAGDDEVPENDPLEIDAREPRRLGISADGVEPGAIAGAAHQELRGDRADCDEQDQVRNALTGYDPDRDTAATNAGAAARRRSRRNCCTNPSDWPRSSSNRRRAT